MVGENIEGIVCKGYSGLSNTRGHCLSENEGYKRDKDIPLKGKIMETDRDDSAIEMLGEMTIQGRIIPTEWDKRGNVTGIGIDCDGEEYIVFLNKTGEKLFRHVNRKVEATGSVKKMFGDLILTIETYNISKEGHEAG